MVKGDHFKVLLPLSEMFSIIFIFQIILDDVSNLGILDDPKVQT